MTDKLSQRLSTFLLSAIELKALNPKWSDQMVQDYLDIFRNLAMIAEAADGQVDFGNGLESLIFSNEAMVNRIRVRVNELFDRQIPVENNGNTRGRLNSQGKILNELFNRQEFVENNGNTRARLAAQEKRINNIEQLAHSW